MASSSSATFDLMTRFPEGPSLTVFCLLANVLGAGGPSFPTLISVGDLAIILTLSLGGDCSYEWSMVYNVLFGGCVMFFFGGYV
ncbi:hypothetical protein BC829DRAFT_397692, partial [Chytridium lagenaria]